MGRIRLTLKTFERGWSRRRADYRYRYACKRGFSLLTDADYRSFYGRHAVVLYKTSALQRLLQLLEPLPPPKTH